MSNKNRLKELRVKKGLTQEKLSKMFNLSRSSIAMYETNSAAPDFNTISDLSNFFNVTPEYLMGKTEFISLENEIEIDILGKIPAGVPISAVTDKRGKVHVSRDLLKKGEIFALEVEGDSMSPQILSGDIVICVAQTSADNGDVCVVFVNGDDATLKRIKKERIGITLLPNNPSYDPMFYSNKEIEELPVRILGKAIEIRRGI